MQIKPSKQQAVNAALDVMNRHRFALNGRNEGHWLQPSIFHTFAQLGQSLKFGGQRQTGILMTAKLALGKKGSFTKLGFITLMSLTTNKVHLDVQINHFDT